MLLNKVMQMRYPGIPIGGLSKEDDQVTYGNPVDKTTTQWNDYRGLDNSKYDVKGGEIGAHARHTPSVSPNRLSAEPILIDMDRVDGVADSEFERGTMSWEVGVQANGMRSSGASFDSTLLRDTKQPVDLNKV